VTADDTYFEFDDLLVNAAVYRRVLKAARRANNTKAHDDSDNDHRAPRFHVPELEDPLDNHAAVPIVPFKVYTEVEPTHATSRWSTAKVHSGETSELELYEKSENVEEQDLFHDISENQSERSSIRTITGEAASGFSSVEAAEVTRSDSQSDCSEWSRSTPESLSIGHRSPEGKSDINTSHTSAETGRAGQHDVGRTGFTSIDQLDITQQSHVQLEETQDAMQEVLEVYTRLPGAGKIVSGMGERLRGLKVEPRFLLILFS
jgi:hypothetical protein